MPEGRLGNRGTECPRVAHPVPAVRRSGRLETAGALQWRGIGDAEENRTFLPRFTAYGAAPCANDHIHFCPLGDRTYAYISHCTKKRGSVPKIVDPRQRRDEVAAALWRVAHRDSWGAVSLRRVAAEAGLSLGSLQHYFAGMDDLLNYAVDGVLDVLDEQLVDQLTTLADPEHAESTVRQVLQSMIPGATPDPSTAPAPDDLWQVQVMAWLTVVSRAAQNPVMSARLSAGSDRLARAITAALRMSAHRTPEQAQRDARGLLALVEGLLLQLARRDIDPAEAAATITRFVAVAFTG